MSENKSRTAEDVGSDSLSSAQLCADAVKPRLEAENTLKQLDLIAHYLGLGVRDLRESHVKEFQKLAIEGIYPCGGQYRSTTRTAKLQGGDAVHKLPEPASITGHVRHAIDEINQRMSSKTVRYGEDSYAIEVAAYALWRFNWIHPYAGGNGRTARAISYMLLCIDYGGMIKGKPSMPTIILGRHDDYQRALREADTAERQGGENISKMIALVDDAMKQQLQNAANASDSGISSEV